MFTNRKNCDIIVMPNKLNIQSMGVFRFLGITIPFFDDTFITIEFDKMQIPHVIESIVIFPICV